MKKNFKKLFILLVFVIASVISTTLVSAEAILDSFKATSKTIETPIGFITDFHVIKTTDGKHVFCLQYDKKSPNSNIVYTKDSLIKDNGMNYILNKAYTAKSDEDHYIYKSALWIYMIDNNLMEGGHKNVETYKKEVENSKLPIAKTILNLVSEAKKASANDTSAPTIKVDTGAKTFKLDNGYYVSNAITVTSSTGSYEVKLTNAPANSTVEKNGNTFIVKVPANSVNTLDTEINFEVKNSKDIYVSYRYNPSESKFQPLATTYKDTKTSNAKGTLSINNTVSVPFLKIDAETGEPISGAKLELTDSTGKVIKSWTSTKEEVAVTGLKEGKYTLKELEAPDGYTAIEESITFTIDKNGKILDDNNKEVTIIKIANKRQTGGVEISKQDITNKQELPGATLVVKDSNGNIIDEWVSTDKPHYIEKLTPGMYTLTETIAPDGYVLSDETITFTVKDDGTITKVVMYNAPSSKDVPVEPTSSFKSITSSLIGTLVITLGSFIIFKNYKKKENA